MISLISSKGSEPTHKLEPRYFSTPDSLNTKPSFSVSDSPTSTTSTNDSSAKSNKYSVTGSPSPSRKLLKKLDQNINSLAKGVISQPDPSLYSTTPFQSMNKSTVLTDAIEPLNLLNLNSLGEPDPSNIAKHDLLSAVAFDKSGKFLSVGDRGGRMIIFERTETPQGDDFDYLTEFQAHTKKHDTLQNTEIPETVTAI
jgi:hypothetical protein